MMQVDWNKEFAGQHDSAIDPADCGWSFNIDDSDSVRKFSDVIERNFGQTGQMIIGWIIALFVCSLACYLMFGIFGFLIVFYAVVKIIYDGLSDGKNPFKI